MKTLLSITPAAHQLSSHPKFVDILCTAIRAGLFTDSIYDFLYNTPGVGQWDTAAAFEVMSCLLQCGHDLDTFWIGGQYEQPGLPAVQQLSIQQLADLLRLCVNSGRCDSVAGLCRLPAAATLQPQLVFHLCMGILESYPCRRRTDPAYIGLKALLSTAAAQQLPKGAAAALMTAAVEAAEQQQLPLPLPGTAIALLRQQLPQLGQSAVGSNNHLQQQSASLLQHMQQAIKSVTQQLWSVTAGSEFHRRPRPRLLLQLHRACRAPDGSLAAVKQMCNSPAIETIAASEGYKAEILFEGIYAVPMSAIGRCSVAWQRETDLMSIIPAVLPEDQHTPDTLALLLQVCSAAGFTRVMLQLIKSPAAQQLNAADLEPLLLQSMAWESSGTIHIDDERPQVFLGLLKLPGAQGLSATAVSRLIAALAASSSSGLVEEVLTLPSAEHLKAAVICAGVEACFASDHSKFYTGDCVRTLLRLPGAAALAPEQLQGLVLADMKHPRQWALELLLQHPATAKVDGVLVAWAQASLSSASGVFVI